MFKGSIPKVMRNEEAQTRVVEIRMGKNNCCIGKTVKINIAGCSNQLNVITREGALGSKIPGLDKLSQR